MSEWAVTDLANQRLVREALAHIRKTRAPSLDKGSDQCVYSGIGCAASVILKSPESFDSRDSIGSIMCANPELLHEWTVDLSARFANEVQRCHDGLGHMEPGDNFVFLFERNLQNVCAKHSYPYPG